MSAAGASNTTALIIRSDISDLRICQGIVSIRPIDTGVAFRVSVEMTVEGKEKGEKQ